MSEFPDPARDVAPSRTGEPQVAVFAGGCFWCTEAVFKELDGVLEVTSGYVGDVAAKANYGTVCSGETSHAEAVRVRFDPAKLSFGQLLKVFFSVAHDPTQLDDRETTSAASTAHDLPRGRAGGHRRTSASPTLRACSRGRSRRGSSRWSPSARTTTRTTPRGIHNRNRGHRAAEGGEAPQDVRGEAEVAALGYPARMSDHRHFPRSRRTYLTGSRADLRVPFREIDLELRPNDPGAKSLRPDCPPCRYRPSHGLPRRPSRHSS
jgi:hypothetical protein